MKLTTILERIDEEVALAVGSIICGIGHVLIMKYKKRHRERKQREARERKQQERAHRNAPHAPSSLKVRIVHAEDKARQFVDEQLEKHDHAQTLHAYDQAPLPGCDCRMCQTRRVWKDRTP